ncbi:50S ribosomal protein L4, partial [bacterium]|nr:50S ribosomal protein L4 [bacterium]
MPTISVYNQKGESIKRQKLNDKIFDCKSQKEIIHQVVVLSLANKRHPFAHTLKKGDVRGGGKKPWQQKGTGRARVGSIRSPIWRGGGITFGPNKERNYSKKINKKMRKKALYMCLSDKVKDK